MNAIVSKRAGRGGLALMLLLGLTLWGGGAVELALAGTIIDFTGTPDAFLRATQGDSYTFKYQNEETQIQNVGDTLHGILDVTTITATAADGTQTIWFGDGGSDGGQLTGQFDGLTVVSITPQGSGDVVNFSGGELALYSVVNGTYSPDAGGPGDPALDICGTGGCSTPLATANFESGIVPSNAGVTLSSTLTDITSPFTGHGSGYLDIGTNGFGTGADNGLLNSGGLSTNFGARDLFLNSDICNGTPNCQNPSTTWLVYSNDPVVNPVVPEPASVILVGTGLGALGLWRRMARAPKA